MDKQETRDAVAVMQAWVNGKPIQCMTHFGKTWHDVDNPAWDWYNDKYRVKPQAKYRPYSSPEECLNDLRCDGWLRRIEGTTYYMKICSLDEYVDYQRMFREYTYVDGTPFGLKIS